MKTLRLSTTDLVPLTLTRTKGSQAFEAMSQHLQRGLRVELELPTHQPVSLSFLDEIVRRLAASSLLNRVVFVSGSEDVFYKLEQIARLRAVTVHALDLRTHGRRAISPVAA